MHSNTAQQTAAAVSTPSPPPHCTDSPQTAHVDECIECAVVCGGKPEKSCVCAAGGGGKEVRQARRLHSGGWKRRPPPSDASLDTKLMSQLPHTQPQLCVPSNRTQTPGIDVKRAGNGAAAAVPVARTPTTRLWPPPQHPTTNVLLIFHRKPLGGNVRSTHTNGRTKTCGVAAGKYHVGGERPAMFRCCRFIEQLNFWPCLSFGGFSAHCGRQYGHPITLLVRDCFCFCFTSFESLLY